MIDLKEIASAWINSYRADEQTKNLASKRLEICSICDSRRELIKNKNWTQVCGECGCPINKKIFTPKKGGCPLGKWDDVDSVNLKVKTNKTTI